MHEQFRKFARRSSEFVGSAEVFLGACVVIGVWALLGPRFHYSDTWQLVINTTTTIITFLMVFLIQNTQNRDARAIQLKLDELIRAVQGARTGMVRLEELSDEDLCALTGLREAAAETGRVRAGAERRTGAARPGGRGRAVRRLRRAKKLPGNSDRDYQVSLAVLGQRSILTAGRCSGRSVRSRRRGRS